MPDSPPTIGHPVPDWHPRPPPPRTPMDGAYGRLVPLQVDIHAEPLYAAWAEDHEQRNWCYLLSGPFPDLAAYRAWLNADCRGDDPLFYAILDTNGAALGVASYLRITPPMGVIEVGHIHYGNRMQRTPLATEAMYLMMRRAFDELGYRRYEWKCDALNIRSRRAALRLGFRFEGVFRQAIVYKGRNRDTAWFSVIDREWPALKRGFEGWLAAANFTADGVQRRSLAAWMEEVRAG